MRNPDPAESTCQTVPRLNAAAEQRESALAAACVDTNLDICTHSVPGITPRVPDQGDPYDELNLTVFDDGSGEFNVIQRPWDYDPNRNRKKKKTKEQTEGDVDPDDLYITAEDIRLAVGGISTQWMQKLFHLDTGRSYFEDYQSRRLDALKMYRKPVGLNRQNCMQSEVNEQSVRRAKKAMRHAAIQLGSSHLISLTFAENVEDVERAAAVYTRWCKMYSRCLPYEFSIGKRRFHVGTWDYVCVPEPQERGAVHFHVLTNQTHDITLMRKLWIEAQLAEGLEKAGNQVNARYLMKRQDRMKAIRYLAKYLSKSFYGGQMFSKRYYSSRGIPAPRSVRRYSLDPVMPDDLRAYIADQFDGHVVWCDEKKLSGYEMLVGAWVPARPDP